MTKSSSKAFNHSLQTKTFQAHKNKVHSVSWSSDGKKLASSSIDHTARVYTIDKSISSTPKESIELKGHQGDVDQLSWDPSHADRLATVSVDKTVKFWDIRHPKSATHTLETEGENINLCWSPDGKQLAVGNRDDVISFIDVRGGTNGNNNKKPYVFKTMNHDVEINEISWNYAGNLFFLTTGSGTIKVLDYPSCEPIVDLFGHTANCYCIDMDLKGRYFAVGSADALVSLWDLEDFICLKTFSNLDWPVRTLGFSYDGDYIASGSEDLVIDISHVESGQHAHSIQTKAATNSLSWHPSRHLLAYACDDMDRYGRPEGSVHVFGFSS